MEKEFIATKELLRYLEEQAMKHQAIHHYTDMESVIKILESHQFLASTGFHMNDQLELDSGIKSRWKQLYFTSFSYGDESIAMWGLYCFPRESAIRISMSKQAVSEWLKQLTLENTISYGYLGKQYQPLEKKYIKSIVLTDIAYMNIHQQTLRRGKYDRLFAPSLLPRLIQEPEMTGRLKDSAWDTENEVRLLIETVEELNDYENIRLFSSFDKTLFPYLKFMIGPWCDDSTYKLYEKKLMELGILPKQIQRSKFTGLLKMKTPCDKCSYKQGALKAAQFI